MNSSLINLLLWNLHLKRISIDEICLLNEKNLDIIRNFIKDGEIVDINKSFLILDIQRENTHLLLEELV
jgi:hypothetical protein